MLMSAFEIKETICHLYLFFYVIAQFFLGTDFETYLLIFDPKFS